MHIKKQYKEIEQLFAVLAVMRREVRFMQPPGSFLIKERYGVNPFLILISCILSLRTKDTVSVPASFRLFEHAQTPQEILNLSLESLQNLIYPVGFYRQKSKQIHALCQELITRFKGEVPCDMEQLLSLPGVGRKTANLVLAEAFGIPALCVDTHVHRIANRLGFVHTKTPEETEQRLRDIVPESLWIELSRLFVTWGQNQRIVIRDQLESQFSVKN